MDLGAYEFQSPASRISYAWLQFYGLPTDGSADCVGTDNDHMNNWQEWVAGTDPTNAAFVLVMAVPSAETGSVKLIWASVTNRSYYVEWATDLVGRPAFSVLLTNIPGLLGATSCADTNPPISGSAYYRVGVQSQL